MDLRDDLKEEIQRILNYKIRVNTCSDRVPSKSDLTLGETALHIETSVLFVDIRNSSIFANSHWRTTTAKTVNAFLNCALRIIKNNSGEVRSFNGDSLLAFFHPEQSPCDNAVISAMQLVWATNNLITPAISAQGYSNNFDIGIGVSYGDILCTKVGIRGEDNNDLIWPSTQTNFAAKMGNTAKRPYNIFVDTRVWNLISNNLKYVQPPNSNAIPPLVPKFPNGNKLLLLTPFLLPPIRKHIWEQQNFLFANRSEKIFKTQYELLI